MKSTIPVRCSTVLLITYLLAACTPSPSTAIAGNRSPDFYLKTNSIHHKVTIKVLAGEKNTMNFNGYHDGHMVITIPMNWRITIDFVNTDNAQAHSAMIVPLADHTMMDIPINQVAFPHASTPDPTEGTPSHITQSYTFVADHPGIYALACGVPGHAAMGMWDKLVVSATCKTAWIAIARLS